MAKRQRSILLKTRNETGSKVDRDRIRGFYRRPPKYPNLWGLCLHESLMIRKMDQSTLGARESGADSQNDSLRSIILLKNSFIYNISPVELVDAFPMSDVYICILGDIG